MRKQPGVGAFVERMVWAALFDGVAYGSLLLLIGTVVAVGGAGNIKGPLFAALILGMFGIAGDLRRLSGI